MQYSIGGGIDTSSYNNNNYYTESVDKKIT